MPAPPRSVRARLSAGARLIRLDRPIGIWLVLWPALWALWLASGGLPRAEWLAVFITGAVLMRSAGCALNDYADRELDRQVARTRDRPLASGELPPRAALWIAAALLAAAAALALRLPPVSLALAAPAALLAATYPYAKRWHSLPQLHLGLSFAMAVPMAAGAATGRWPEAWVWLLALGTVLWTVAYDTLYAMADRDEDLACGNRSTAILLGRRDLAAVAALQALFLGTLALVGLWRELGAPYWAGLAAAAILLARQLRTARRREPAACLRAFLNNAWVGAAVWAGLAAALWN